MFESGTISSGSRMDKFVPVDNDTDEESCVLGAAAPVEEDSSPSISSHDAVTEEHDVFQSLENLKIEKGAFEAQFKVDFSEMFKDRERTVFDCLQMFVDQDGTGNHPIRKRGGLTKVDLERREQYEEYLLRLYSSGKGRDYEEDLREYQGIILHIGGLTIRKRSLQM